MEILHKAVFHEQSALVQIQQKYRFRSPCHLGLFTTCRQASDHPGPGRIVQKTMNSEIRKEKVISNWMYKGVRGSITRYDYDWQCWHEIQKLCEGNFFGNFFCNQSKENQLAVHWGNQVKRAPLKSLPQVKSSRSFGEFIWGDLTLLIAVNFQHLKLNSSWEEINS